MTEFVKYQHVERLGNLPTVGIMGGTIYVFPKIDGANGSIGITDLGTLWYASRNHKLGIGGSSNLSRLCKYGEDNPAIKTYLMQHPSYILYGEWLIQHKVKYKADAYERFWIFDVYDTATNTYIPYPQYSEDFKALGIVFLPVLAQFTLKPFTAGEAYWTEELTETLNIIKEKYVDNDFLVDTEKSHSEGVVIKNYDWINSTPTGVPRTWAKIINEKYADMPGVHTAVPKVVDERIEQVGRMACTPDLVEKEYQKLRVEHDGWVSKLIPVLMNNVFEAVKTEELDEVKRKMSIAPDEILDERSLRRVCGQIIKECKADLFT